MTRTLNADEFARALTAVVPERVRPKLGHVMFDATTQLHEAVVTAWPVDTGYSRAGFTATTGDESPRALPPRDENANYAGQFGSSDADAASAIGRASKELSPLTMGFTAAYTLYVEDTVNVVKSARGQWPTFVENAVRNAENAENAESTGGAP